MELLSLEAHMPTNETSPSHQPIVFETGGLQGSVETAFRDQCRSAATGFGGQARFPRKRRQSSAAAVVDAL